MITELNRILRTDQNVDEALMKNTAYRLLSRQFLYHRKVRQRRYYQTVVTHFGYFTDLMDALNYTLVHNDEQGYVGIVPREYDRRMGLDETLFLLVLRILYDEARRSFSANDDGTVDVRLDDLETRYRQLTEREPPETFADFRRQFGRFEEHGIMELTRDDDAGEIRVLRIMPAIISLVSGDTTTRIRNYLKAEEILTEDGEEEA